MENSAHSRPYQTKASFVTKSTEIQLSVYLTTTVTTKVADKSVHFEIPDAFYLDLF